MSARITQHKWSTTLVSVAVFLGTMCPAFAGQGVPRGPGGVLGHFTDAKAVIEAEVAPGAPQPIAPAPGIDHARDHQIQSMNAKEYRLVLDCGYRRFSSVSVADDVGACQDALTSCQYRTPPSPGPLYLLWQRPKQPPNQPWEYAGEYCGTKAVPPGVAKPPQVPSLGDIQRAFRALPFSKPTVSIQPVGNVTLVNLPTYFQATWPGDAGLQPGDTSRPVQLLSWSVEFRVAAHTYDFHYGDGTSSGPVTDAGGVFSDGAIRHTFDRPIPHAQVRVDTTLTGQFRANGGAWVDVDTVADLQNEPVTVLEVKQAQARLVTH